MAVIQFIVCYGFLSHMIWLFTQVYHQQKGKLQEESSSYYQRKLLYHQVPPLSAEAQPAPETL